MFSEAPEWFRIQQVSCQPGCELRVQRAPSAHMGYSNPPSVSGPACLGTVGQKNLDCHVACLPVPEELSLSVRCIILLFPLYFGSLGQVN